MADMYVSIVAWHNMSCSIPSSSCDIDDHHLDAHPAVTVPAPSQSQTYTDKVLCTHLTRIEPVLFYKIDQARGDTVITFKMPRLTFSKGSKEFDSESGLSIQIVEDGAAS